MHQSHERGWENLEAARVLEKGVSGLPDERAWNQAIESGISECAKNEAVVIESRVITLSEDVDAALAAAGAALHRDSLSARGFTQAEVRVEYRMDLGEAVSALEQQEIVAKLSWTCNPGFGFRCLHDLLIF